MILRSEGGIWGSILMPLGLFSLVLQMDTDISHLPSLSLAQAQYFPLARVSRKMHLFYIFLKIFLGPHPRHMEVPRLGVTLEL
mgnify:CR=1 FL=1